MTYQGAAIYIPAFIDMRDDLSLTDKYLYGRILALTKKEGYCWANNKFLSHGLGLNDRSITRHITNLVEKKLIVRDLVRNENGLIIKRKLFAFLGGCHLDLSEMTPPPVTDGGYKQEYIKTIKEHIPIATKTKFRELTREDIVGVATELRLTIPVVHRKHEEIMGLVRNGGFEKYKKAYDDTRDVLKKWLRMGLDNCKINHRNNIEDLSFEYETEKYYQNDLYLG